MGKWDVSFYGPHIETKKEALDLEQGRIVQESQGAEIW